jgi:hypothetical protein
MVRVLWTRPDPMPDTRPTTGPATPAADQPPQTKKGGVRTPRCRPLPRTHKKRGARTMWRDPLLKTGG